MAISATNTRESQQAVQSALQERQRKEALQRKQQAEREAREREQAAKHRAKIFEEEKRQKERQEKLEAERRAKDAARERKEEEQRNHLLYGPKKAAKMAASSSTSLSKYPQSAAAKEAALNAKKPTSSLIEEGGPVLTREEIRQRKREAELRRQFAFGNSRKSHGGYHRDGHRLPGGAVNIVVNGGQIAHAQSSTGKTLKERLSQGPNTLVQLQTKARDRRTVDEAQQDIRIKLGKAAAKVLSGEDARSFDDWFGSGKDKQPSRSPAPSSPAPNARTFSFVI